MFYGHRGPSFESQDYDMPDEQAPTQLFYHDHTMGVTLLGMHSGIVGAAYFIRDPNNPLDQPTSPLPKRSPALPTPRLLRSARTRTLAPIFRPTLGRPGAESRARAVPRRGTEIGRAEIYIFPQGIPHGTKFIEAFAKRQL